MARPDAAIGRNLFRGCSFRMHGWCASLSFLLCPEQYMGSQCQRGSGRLGNPWKPGPGWDCSSGTARGCAAGTVSHTAWGCPQEGTVGQCEGGSYRWAGWWDSGDTGLPAGRWDTRHSPPGSTLHSLACFVSKIKVLVFFFFN